MGAISKTLGWDAMNACGVAFLIAYVGLVVIGYVTEGPRYQFKFDVRSPWYSTKRLLVGMGVWFVAWILRFAQLLLTPLFEASAEVGEWVTQRTSPETQARFRSHFI